MHEDAIVANAEAEQLAKEVRMYQESCEEHIRIRNEQAARIAELEAALRRLSSETLI